MTNGTCRFGTCLEIACLPARQVDLLVVIYGSNGARKSLILSNMGLKEKLNFLLDEFEVNFES